MVLTAYSVLSPVTGLSCHRRLRRLLLAELDASVGASGPHDFAVRQQAPLVHARFLRPPHPAPDVRDDREPPLCGHGMARVCRDDLPDGQSGIFFLQEGWTAATSADELICPSGKSAASCSGEGRELVIELIAILRFP